MLRTKIGRQLPVSFAIAGEDRKASKRNELNIVISKSSRNMNNYLTSLFKQRHIGSEIWLVDVSSFTNFEKVTDALGDILQVDLDDDFFIYQFGKNNSNTAILWEVYKIHASQSNLIINRIGDWSSKKGLFINVPEKWKRRKDLKVSYHVD